VGELPARLADLGDLKQSRPHPEHVSHADVSLGQALGREVLSEKRRFPEMSGERRVFAAPEAVVFAGVLMHGLFCSAVMNRVAVLVPDRTLSLDTDRSPERPLGNGTALSSRAERSCLTHAHRCDFGDFLVPVQF
jgi:hypothetical protein